MDAHKAALEIQMILGDHGVVLPTDPYDARNLEETITEFLDRFFDDAYEQGGDNADSYAYQDGHAAGYDEGHSDAINKVYGALDNLD